MPSRNVPLTVCASAGMAAEENKEARAAAEGAGGDAAGPEALAPAAAGGALGG